eukprot:COSAG05_NODE_14637_length_391_cov_1.506849_1_plen_116_part_01
MPPPAEDPPPERPRSPARDVWSKVGRKTNAVGAFRSPVESKTTSSDVLSASSVRFNKSRTETGSNWHSLAAAGKANVESATASTRLVSPARQKTVSATFQQYDTNNDGVLDEMEVS